MYERMLALRDPARRQAAILFADVEASGELSRRLSSQAYFALIRSLTDLVDAAVVANGGLIGKHAGDGASALFVVDGAEGESAAARARSMPRVVSAMVPLGFSRTRPRFSSMSVFTGGRR
jgi:class 3 adenylate cyclase